MADGTEGVATFREAHDLEAGGFEEELASQLCEARHAKWYLVAAVAEVLVAGLFALIPIAWSALYWFLAKKGDWEGAESARKTALCTLWVFGVVGVIATVCGLAVVGFVGA